jgi:hypothetical protein
MQTFIKKGNLLKLKTLKEYLFDKLKTKFIVKNLFFTI